jgi:hypothetical protein
MRAFLPMVIMTMSLSRLKRVWGVTGTEESSVAVVRCNGSRNGDGGDTYI